MRMATKKDNVNGNENGNENGNSDTHMSAMDLGDHALAWVGDFTLQSADARADAITDHNEAPLLLASSGEGDVEQRKSEDNPDDNPKGDSQDNSQDNSRNNSTSMAASNLGDDAPRK